MFIIKHNFFSRMPHYKKIVCKKMERRNKMFLFFCVYLHNFMYKNK